MAFFYLILIVIRWLAVSIEKKTLSHRLPVGRYFGVWLVHFVSVSYTILINCVTFIL